MIDLSDRDLTNADRRSFERRFKRARSEQDARRRSELLKKLQTDVEKAEQRVAARRSAVPTKYAYPDELPITERRAELLEVIRDNQVIIVAGETGSGKSTQLPKFCLELGRGVLGTIGHTQPRRIAARSIAERVAEELGSEVGQLVGFTVRFSDRVGDQTLVKVMTDGILLNEIHRDRFLNQYDTIIIDEAHERGLNTDFLLGYLKRLLPKRPDLKLIITSATIDTERFSDHFSEAPIIEVSGRTYPVEIRYRPLEDELTTEPKDQVQGITEAVQELFAEGSGDVLVFCSGEREIRDAVEALEELNLRHTSILPLYGRLSAAEQHRVFSSHTGRRVVVSTNVAETSLTVPGIRYVVDAGTARISRYNRRTKTQRLPIEEISQASANQRSGRCGRLGPGIAIRLYSDEDFAGRPEFTDPEILRTQLGSVMLKMSALGLGDIETFPFLDPPDSKAVRDGLTLLTELGAMDGEQKLTKIGRSLSSLPVDLRLGRMILAADSNVCLREVLIIVSGLSIQDPRERPVGSESLADQSHARFADATSDFLSWLALWDYLRKQRKAKSGNQFRRMCRDEFLNYRRVREWQDVEQQLREAAKDMGFRMNRQPATGEAIHLAMMAGLLAHVGSKDPASYEYRGARGARFAISPGSSLFKRGPEWVIAAELVETSRLWARGVVGVDPLDVAKVGEHLVKRSYSDPWWDVKKGASLAHETATLFGLPLYSDRAVQYGRIDPPAARELLIRHVLVASEWTSHHAFVEHNRLVMADALDVESRHRRTDVLIDDDEIVAWFSERIPDDIVTVRHFDRWWRDVSDKRVLNLSLEDLLEADMDEGSEFPRRWSFGDLDIPIDYEFDPSSPRDGVTFEIPIEALERIDRSSFAWLVPGRRRELFDAMIRTLPKQTRKALAPIGDTVDALLRVEPQGDLRSFLRSELRKRGGLPIDLDAFGAEDLPAFLRPWFRIVDGATVLGEGADLNVLATELAEQARSAAASGTHDIERSGSTVWDFGAIPEWVTVGESRTRAYPALTDEGSSVGVQLYGTEADQYAAMWDGVRRLLRLRLPPPGKALGAFVTADRTLALSMSPYESQSAWAEDCLTASLDDMMVAQGLPWDAVAYDELLRYTKTHVSGALTQVAEDSLATIESHRALVTALDRAPADVADDIESHMSRLMYPNFVSGLGLDRVADVGRYVEAARRRIDNPGRNDRQHMATAQALEDEFDRVSDALPGAAGLLDVAWMLQELRVSLFAQSLGTRGSVSVKRIRNRLDEIAAQ